MYRLLSSLLVLILFVGMGTPLLAQNTTVGLKAGIDFADLDVDPPATSSDIRTGFSAGVLLGVNLHRLFRLQGEAQYVQKGAKATGDGVERTVKLSYMELLVPFTLLIPAQGASVQPRLYGGPAIAFELDCKIRDDRMERIDTFDCEVETGPTSSVDIGIFLGGGIDIPAGPGSVTLDLLYNLGLSDIADEPDESVKNRNIQILAGYGFSIGP